MLEKSAFFFHFTCHVGRMIAPLIVGKFVVWCSLHGLITMGCDTYFFLCFHDEMDRSQPKVILMSFLMRPSYFIHFTSHFGCIIALYPCGKWEAWWSYSTWWKSELVTLHFLIFHRKIEKLLSSIIFVVVCLRNLHVFFHFTCHIGFMIAPLLGKFGVWCYFSWTYYYGLWYLFLLLATG
jgi:hypothetical protein